LNQSENIFMRAIVLILFFTFGISPAFAGSICATKNGLAYTLHPPQGNLPQQATANVKSGTTYTFTEEDELWIRVLVKNVPVWAEKKLFTLKGACPATQPKVASKDSSNSATATALPASKALPKQSRVTQTQVSGCTCGSGQVCIGKRGGRFCITSGGKKRYGV
jgi:hypothetical protein